MKFAPLKTLESYRYSIFYPDFTTGFRGEFFKKYGVLAEICASETINILWEWGNLPGFPVKILEGGFTNIKPV